jgi:two-component system cell cycle response regulator DivK
MLLCEALESAGYVVESTCDGANVLNMIELVTPHLITMDIDLPNISGTELIRKIKADSRLMSIPVLAITAHVGRGNEMEIISAGSDAYLPKPISIREFLDTVNRLVSGGKLIHN